MRDVLSLLYNIVFWLIVLRAVSSFLPGLQNNPVLKFAHDVTEPLLSPVRKVIGVVRLGDAYVDLSPLVLLFLLNLLRGIL